MNGLSERIRRSWELFKRSVQVMREHPKLLLFPVVTGVLTFAIALFFLAPVGLMLLAPHWVRGGTIQAIADSIGFLQFPTRGSSGFQVQVHPVGTVILAVMYLVNMFLATMCTTAFDSEILEALSGRPVSLRHGMAVACSRWKAVLLWSLLAGLVGLIIRALEERFALVGRLLAGMVGLVWSVASIFAIPVLIRETSLQNPFTLVSRSAQIIKRTWGEMLVGYVGMQGSNLLFLLVSVVYWGVAIGAGVLFSNGWLILLAVAPWLLCLLVYSYLASIASRVYLCALYLYAADGVVPGYFEQSMMGTGWKLKKA